MDFVEISSYVGLTAVTLLTLNILIGLLLSTKYNPVRRWPHRRINTVLVHNWTGYIALATSLVHPLIILLSTTAKFRVIDVFYPVNAPKQATINTLGALGLYAVAFVVVTSYFRWQIGRRLWKALHFTAYAAAAVFFTHAVLTDPNLKDAPFDPIDAEKVYVELLALLVIVGAVLRVRWQMRQGPPRVHRPKATR